MKIAVLIDGGYLRSICQKEGMVYNNDFIESFSYRCIAPEEQLFRIYYYDAPPFVGTVKTPVSGENLVFEDKSGWIKHLSQKEKFAVRTGRLAFRGFKLKKEKFEFIDQEKLTDQHFRPIFEQKGVDMRIGLDIATLSNNKIVDRIALVSGDADIEPALKYGRIAGVQTVLILIEEYKRKTYDRLMFHADIKRIVSISEL